MPGKYYTLRRNSSNCHIFEFKPSELRMDATIGVRFKLEKLSTLNGEPTPDEKTYAKLNGGFFQMDGSTEYIGTFVDDGLYYNKPNMSYPTLIYWKTGPNKDKLTYCLNPNTAQLNEYQRDAQFALGVPWMLVIDGKQNYIYSKKELIAWFGHPNSRCQRTMIGQKADGTIVWVAVDGRKASSVGMNIDQTAALMLELGCVIAANLDGGGSTEMIIDGKIKNSLISGERKIGTALMAYAKKTDTSGTATVSTNNDTQPISITEMSSAGVISASTWLNVRKAPNTGATILGTLQGGAEVSITGSSNGWYRIMYNGAVGWVSGNYVKVKTAAGGTITNLPSGTTTSALNMRTGPSTSYSKILCIPKGALLRLQGSSNGWYKVTYNSKEGWVCGDYIKT